LSVKLFQIKPFALVLRLNKVSGSDQFQDDRPTAACPFKQSPNGILSHGGVHRYAAQANLKIDTARGKKHPFRTETEKADVSSSREM
jgi:hypothetical protein